VKGISMNIRGLVRSAAVVALIVTSFSAARSAGADARLAWMEIDGALAERPGPFAWLGGQMTPTLTGVVGKLDAVAGDASVDGVVLRVKSPAWNAAQIAEVGAALQRVRAAGKTVHAFADIYEPGALRLASYADAALMQEGGAVFFPGLHMEEMFLAGTLAKVGAEADYVQVGDYKGASEMFANSEPSPEWNANISRLLDSMYGAMREEIKSNRGMSDRELDRAMEAAWYASGETAERVGLIDGELDRAELTAFLSEAYGDGVRYTLEYDPARRETSVDMGNPFAMLQMLSEDPKNEPERDTIAVVHIDGPIVDGESAPASALGGASVGAETIREALKEIEDEELVHGVVVRINSPGGSAIASENIWQGVKRVAATRPVWVSVGSMAASGGYYIAVAGDRIVASEHGIVGSIGVVGGKIALGGVYEKLDANVVSRSRGPRAGMFATGELWSESERALVRERMAETYELFTDRVRQGRSGIDLGKTAEGRLFTGRDAVALKMADEVGGLHDAIAGVASAAGVEGSHDVMHYPGPQSFDELLERFSGIFGVRGGVQVGAGSSPLAGAFRELLGEEAWGAARASMAALLQLREEPVLLTMPRVLIFR